MAEHQDDLDEDIGRYINCKFNFEFLTSILLKAYVTDTYDKKQTPFDSDTYQLIANEPIAAESATQVKYEVPDPYCGQYLIFQTTPIGLDFEFTEIEVMAIKFK